MIKIHRTEQIWVFIVDLKINETLLPIISSRLYTYTVSSRLSIYNTKCIEQTSHKILKI